MGNMGEMPVIEGLQAKRAEFRGAKIEDDMRSDDAKDMEAEKKILAAESFAKAKDFQAQLVGLEAKIKAGGPLKATYEKIRDLLEVEYDAAMDAALKNSTESSDTALMQ
ncbi:MAG: hypothetical protein KA034_02345 [Candidatus Moranbacteria bacterium]|nr:hypothetical protein [Candidatus Moranbacteria bacterium]